MQPCWVSIVSVTRFETPTDGCDVPSIEPEMAKRFSPDSGLGSPTHDMLSNQATTSFQRTSTPIEAHRDRRFSRSFSSFTGDDDLSQEIEYDLILQETLHGFDGNAGMHSFNSETSNCDVSERDVIRTKRKINNNNEINKRRALCLKVDEEMETF